MVPSVRVVVVNYNGGELIGRCLEHLRATEWPRDRLELVVVDNASSDGSADGIARRFPDVRLIRSPRNTGFAGGCNLGMRDLGSVDQVALVNSDAFVTPGWLAPLSEVLTADRSVGAACPKILFAPRFVEVELAADADVPGSHDPRRLGVRLSGVRCGDLDGWPWAGFERGFYWAETDHSVAGEPQFRWSMPNASLWAPVPEEAEPLTSVELRMAAVRDKPVTVSSGSGVTTVTVGPTPQWFRLPADGGRFDVVNNAGSVLMEGGHGADRGFWERDQGQYDQTSEVFAWCGAAVLLSVEYLRDVGLFCEQYFLYYEDFDLSWRGRSRGWRYLFVPASVVRHVHAASTIEGSPLFEHYVRRNRLLTLAKNAPLSCAAKQVWGFVDESRRLATQELVLPLLRRQRPRPTHTRRQVQAGAAFVKHLPHALRARRKVMSRATVHRTELMGWTIPSRA
ncbi:MAG TPA: glycosyltransferase [Acidimicrobiales bacterium]|nr:glycosyltransferase [Acidimicrobiales bacterium]